MHFALEFRNISYEIDNLLYSRRSYRKNMTASGHIVLNEEKQAFNTENVSVDGMMVRLAGLVETKLGSVASYQFESLELSGEAKVIWLEHANNSTLMGLEYLHLEKDGVKGVPRFIH